MSDLPASLPVPESAEHIPAMLAAPKAKRGRKDIAPVVTPAAEPAPIAAAPAHPVHEEPIMATTFENATTQTDTGAHKAAAMFGDLNERATGAMEKGGKMVAELNSLNKGNVEALVESGKLAVAGMQTLAQAQAAYVRKQFEEATAAARTLASAKSPTEFMKLQGDYVRQQFDAMIAETSRSTESMLKIAGEVVQPISNRVAITVEKIKAAA